MANQSLVIDITSSPKSKANLEGKCPSTRVRFAVHV